MFEVGVRWLGDIERLVVTGFAKGVAEPFETLVQTVSGCGASRLDVLLTNVSFFVLNKKVDASYPSTLPQAVETKFVGDFSRVHSVLQMC